MRPPVEHVRISAKGKEILIRIKRRTGLEHWNEICRIALCSSLANPKPTPKLEKAVDSSIDMDWKTFAGSYQKELLALIIICAEKDGVNTSVKEQLSEYFKSHLERGISSLQNIKCLQDILNSRI